MTKFFESSYYDWISLAAIVAKLVTFVLLLYTWVCKIQHKRQVEFDTFLEHYTTNKEEFFRSIEESKTQGKRMGLHCIIVSTITGERRSTTSLK